MGVAAGTRARSWALLFALAAAWILAYLANENLWPWAFQRLGLDLSDPLFGALEFFGYETGKVLLLLVGMIFAIGLVRTSLRPETVRNYLHGKPGWLALVLAALLGAITPFCSCSSIPLFIGFVASGVPIAVTLTFLIASPLVNEVAVVMLGQSFGWDITVKYVIAGLLLAILLGAIFSRLRLENHVYDFVRTTPITALQDATVAPTLAQRIAAATEETREIVGRVWRWVILGVAVGALIHGWVPTQLLASYAGADNPFAVVVVTAVGVPLYSNAAGVVPIAEALWSKGMAVGTTFTFIMATTALSIPEAILLRQVLKPRLLALFFGSVAAGAMLVGFLFNAVA